MTMPSVSFILPVLNAEKVLPACLSSIRNQDYTGTYEILLADGGSTDRTLEIADAHHCVRVKAEGLLAEAAKHRALLEAKGDFIVMIDADNEIARTDWLRLAIDALQRTPGALGFESYYIKHPQDSRLNRYMTGSLQISDVWARTVAGSLRVINRSADGVTVFALPKDGAYPTGANGFIFERALLSELAEDKPFHEATFFPTWIRRGRNQLVKRTGCGVYHHYIQGWMDLYKKKQRVAIQYLLRRDEVTTTLDSDSRTGRKVLAMAYHGTIVGPTVEGLIQSVRQRDADWLLHPAAAFISTLATAVGVLKYWRSGSREKRASAAQHLHRQIEDSRTSHDKTS